MKVAKQVLRELGSINTLHRGFVEQAGFAVLKSPDIPSILVETAFISNPVEERRLSDDNYRDKLAHAILNGVKHYFAKIRRCQSRGWQQTNSLCNETVYFTFLSRRQHLSNYHWRFYCTYL